MNTTPTRTYGTNRSSRGVSYGSRSAGRVGSSNTGSSAIDRYTRPNPTDGSSGTQVIRSSGGSLGHRRAIPAEPSGIRSSRGSAIDRYSVGKGVSSISRSRISTPDRQVKPTEPIKYGRGPIGRLDGKRTDADAGTSRRIGAPTPGDVAPTRSIKRLDTDADRVGSSSGKNLRRVDGSTPVIGTPESRRIGGGTGQPPTVGVDPSGGRSIRSGDKSARRVDRRNWNGFRPSRRGWYEDHPNRWNNYWGYSSAFCQGYGFGWNYGLPCYGFGPWGGTGFGLYGCLNWGVGFGYSYWGWNHYRRWNSWWWYPNHCYFGYASLPAFSYFLTYPYVTTTVVESSPEVIYIDSGAPDIVIYEDDDDLDRWILGGGEVGAAVEPSVPAPGDAVPEAPRPTGELSLAEKYLKLGDLYFRAGRYREAADAYARAIELAPGEGALHLILSDALFATGDYHAAAYAIRRALEEEPSLAGSRVDKRTFYSDPAVFAEHLERLETFTRDYPEDADGWLVLGYNRLFAKDPAGAKEAFEKARRHSIGEVDAIQKLLDAALERMLEDAESTRSGKAPEGKID